MSLNILDASAVEGFYVVECPECSRRLGVPVQIKVQVGFGSRYEHLRVREFNKVHEEH